MSPRREEDERMNVVEGTRQNRTVTSEEGAPLLQCIGSNDGKGELFIKNTGLRQIAK